MTARPHLLVAAVLLVSLAASACGGDDTDSSEDEPTSTTEPVEVDDPTPTPEPTPTPAPPADEDVVERDGPAANSDGVLFAVFTGGGFVPIEVALSQFPELVVMADGTAYRPGAQIAVFPPPLAPAVERLQLSDDVMDRIREIVITSPVLEGGFDFGQPNITDVGTTTVSAGVGDSIETVSAYALGFEEGMNPEDQANRDELRAVISEITALVDSATATADLANPPALAVITFPTLTFQEDDRVRDWPIESVPTDEGDGRGCVVVEGDAVAVLMDALGNATIQTPWDLGDRIAPVAIRPVFPHEDVC